MLRHFVLLERPFGFLFPLRVGLLIALVWWGLGGIVQAQPEAFDRASRIQLAQTINDTIEAEPYQNSWWGIQIINLETQKRIYTRNAVRSYVPASNVKLLTAFAALDRLGPEYRYHTPVYIDGEVQNGTLKGNLLVRGSGDPTLGGYEQRTNPTQVFRNWADSLRRRGIQHIDGDVIADDGPFSDRPLGTGWSWDWIPYYYAAEPNGLVFNSNTVDLIVSGRDPGEPADVSWEPYQTDFVQVLNRTRTVAPDSATDTSYERALGTNRIEVDSRVHPEDADTSAVTITDPTEYFAQVLRASLLANGISVDGEAVDGDQLARSLDYDADEVRQVASYRSPPLRDILRTLNHESHNLYAEQLFRTMAVESPPDTTKEDFPEGSAALGALAVRTSLAQTGIDTSRVQLVGGSGLSRKNLLSPRVLGQLLTHIWTEADSSSRTAFYESLPTGGEEGTLAGRYEEEASARGNVRAKTGTLSNVSALSGYVRTKEGTPLAFVILNNHHTTESGAVRSAQDAIVNALARFPE